MKFSIGDQVLLINSNEIGIVTAYLDHVMIEVEVQGVRFPVFLDEVEHPYLKWFLDQKNKDNKEKKMSLENLPIEKEKPKYIEQPGFYFSFLPVFKKDYLDNIIDRFKVFIISQSAYKVQFYYECHTRNEGVVFDHSFILQPFSNIYIHDLPFELMSTSPNFVWSLQHENDSQSFQTSNNLRIKPKKLFEYITRIQLQNEPQIIVKISDDLIVSPKPSHNPINKLGVEIKNKKVGKQVTSQLDIIYEIDLHIEQLTKSWRGLTNYEILSWQLSVFEQALQTALQTGQDHLTVIHGVGKGTLKTEVHKILKMENKVSHFIHQWMPRYGMGATQVFFK